MPEQQDAALVVLEQVLIDGDLSKLTLVQRTRYYKMVCQSLGLNFLTRPFEYIKVNNKLILYARRDATDQIRKINRISIEIIARERIGGVYVVTARATMPDGRTDEAIGAIALIGGTGRDLGALELANAFMKAETKAKRRVTLSIFGLGWSDETEIESLLEAGIARREALPAPKKFAEMSDEEKREFLSEGWHTRLDALRDKWVLDQVPTPNFQEDALEKLIQAAKYLSEMEKETKEENIPIIISNLELLLGTQE